MKPRQFFGMTYDESIGKVVAAGGDTGTDVWYFDGTRWTAGPSLPSEEPKERFRMAYDPDLGGDVYASGLGPAQADGQMWMLKDGTWTRLIQYGETWPSDRVDGGLVWNPDEDALMMFSGIADDFMDGRDGLSDTLFFHETQPVVASATIAPDKVFQDQPISLTWGDTLGGYGPSTKQLEWFVNG